MAFPNRPLTEDEARQLIAWANATGDDMGGFYMRDVDLLADRRQLRATVTGSEQAGTVKIETDHGFPPAPDPRSVLIDGAILAVAAALLGAAALIRMHYA